MTDEPASSEVAAATPPATRRGPLRRLYDWVLAWADTPYGTPALAVLSFAESSFFPIPPDVLQIALSVARPRRSFFYAAVSAVASVLGGLFGWTIGYVLWSAAVEQFFFDYMPGFSRENFQAVHDLYHQNAFLGILGAGFTPIPYKVFTITAGVFEVPLAVLLAASAIGRSARFFIVATCIFFFGPSVKAILERYFNLITLVAFVLFVGGFLAIKYLL